MTTRKTSFPFSVRMTPARGSSLAPRRILTGILAVVSLSLVSAAAYAQEPAPRQDRNQNQSQGNRRVNPAFEPVEDDPALPRVLLIGDSISIGYTVPLRKRLAYKANVHRPPTNCGPTTRGLEQLDQWLGDKKWDLIHFNWGLHDLKYVGPQGQNLVDPRGTDSRQQVPPEQYESNLRQLVQRLKKTGAILVWRSTTPVPDGAQGRVPGDAAKYNEIAARVMRDNGVEIDDMFAFCKPRLNEIQQPANVHFTPGGSRILAEHSAAIIEAQLEKYKQE